MTLDTTFLGSVVRWMALTGLVCHLAALVWACRACCWRRKACPFSPSTRIEAGRVWAWEQLHPGHLWQDYSNHPRQRQMSPQVAGSQNQIQPENGLQSLVKFPKKGTKGVGRQKKE